MTQPYDSQNQPPPHTSKSRPWWRRTWAWVTAVALVALFIGVGIGSSGGSSSAKAEPTPTPATTTVTAKAPPAAAPAACLRAISDAEHVGVTAGRTFGVVAKYPPLVGKAAIAGEHVDVGAINAITAKMRGLNSQITTASRTLTGQVAAFNIDKTACRGIH